MIQRTYVCKPSGALLGLWPNLDIMLEGPVGTQAAPVADIADWPGAVVTTPPAAWAAACGAGAYYEIRGRTLRFENRTGAAGFAPRMRLGWSVAIHQYNDGLAMSNLVPGYQLSASALGALGDGVVINCPILADPAYGPVLRIVNDPGFHILGRAMEPTFIVHLTVYEARDEDSNPTR